MVDKEFLKTKEWKAFSKQVKLNVKVCEITKQKLAKGSNVHHLDPKGYKDLKKDKFVALNKFSHDVVHWLDRTPIGWRAALKNLETILKKMEKYK